MIGKPSLQRLYDRPMAPSPPWCAGWWAQIDGDLKLPGLAHPSAHPRGSQSRSGKTRVGGKQSRRRHWRPRDPSSGSSQALPGKEAVAMPKAKKGYKLTAAHEVSSKLATLENESADVRLAMRATVSGASGSTGFRRMRPKSGRSGSPRKDLTDSHERLPPLELSPALPVVVEAPTSVTICVDGRTERVMPHLWLVMESTTTVEAALNCLHGEAGGGSVTEGHGRLQQVSDDRLHATGAQANFQRCARATSLASLRHAALILALCGNREKQAGCVVPMGPAPLAPSAAELSARARRVESLVGFRAATASQRPRPGTVQVSPRTTQLPVLVEKRSPRQSAMQKGLQALEEFNRFAEHKFGNTVRAWFMLDPDQKMSIGEKQFARACDEIGFHGNVVSLWRYLDSDQSGQITILELDAAAAVTLAELKIVIRDRFNGSSIAAFEYMDDNKSDRLFKDEFVKSMRQLGFKATRAAKLFSMFDKQRLGSITSKDIVFLDRWNPPPYLFAKPDAVGLENFKTALRNIFSSLLRAWRQLLDRDATMRVSWDEFVETCQYLQKKSLQHGLPQTDMQRAGIWRALDEDCGGWIALQEFDQEAFDCIAGFKHWATDHHGLVCTAFQALAGQTMKLTEHELRKIEGIDAKLLIQGLNVNGNVTIHHSIDEQTGKKVSWDVPFLIEKDVRFLDKWDLEWEEEEARAKKRDTCEDPGQTQKSFRAGS